MRGKLEVEGPPAAPQLASQLARAEGSHVCQLCLRRAALGGPGSRGEARRPPGGRAGRRPRWPPGVPPAAPAGSGAILPGGTAPAPGRPGRAGPAPSRPSPAEAVLAPLPRLPPPTSAEGGRCGLAASRRLGARGPASSPPCSRRAPGMLLRAGSPAVWTPLPEDGRSHRNSAGLGSSIQPESRSRALHRWLL